MGKVLARNIETEPDCSENQGTGSISAHTGCELHSPTGLDVEYQLKYLKKQYSTQTFKNSLSS